MWFEFRAGALFPSLPHFFYMQLGRSLDTSVPPFHISELRLGLFPYFKDKYVRLIVPQIVIALVLAMITVCRH